MKMKIWMIIGICLTLTVSSCISKKTLEESQAQTDQTSRDLAKCGEDLNAQMALVEACEQEKETLRGNIRTLQSTVSSKDNQIADLRAQIEDLRQQRDKQMEQVTGLTVLSQSANENINRTLGQMEQRDQYIRLLQSAKTKADSINLVLSANLKGQLAQGIADNDVEVKVDKTVVFVNLSDKMLYTSGSSALTSRAKDVLAKIALIVQGRPELEIMVEGYTDNRPIKRECFKDNWDLSVKRATSVVRLLQNDYGVDPNRLIAAGRGEYNILASNDTPEGMALNRRTRLIILPKLDQFYDLLNPDMVPK
jgi:Flagellar motor protein